MEFVVRSLPGQLGAGQQSEIWIDDGDMQLMVCKCSSDESAKALTEHLNSAWDTIKHRYPKATYLQEFDLTPEEWREYDFGGRVYRIESPKSLFMRQGGTTHRVVDQGNVVHCVPAPGQNGCILRWKSRNTSEPVSF